MSGWGGAHAKVEDTGHVTRRLARVTLAHGRVSGYSPKRGVGRAPWALEAP